jgi:hypothetical protein
MWRLDAVNDEIGSFGKVKRKRGTTRGGCKGFERRELSRRAEPAPAGRHGRGATSDCRSG